MRHVKRQEKENDSIKKNEAGQQQRILTQEIF